ncbi:22905_t:CDS:2, partial [Rhizophagus irregularis]
TEYHEKPLVDVETDNSFPEEQDDDMIQEESLDENQIVEQGLIHELCSSILPEDNVSSTEIISSC